jgi:1,6-anhydro-N-acetylmuramate kinase
VTKVGVFAWFGWTAAVAALQTGRLICSGSERRVLLLAASLGEGVPVDLSDVLTGLDEATTALVVNAIAHAGGHWRDVTALGGGRPQ